MSSTVLRSISVLALTGCGLSTTESAVEIGTVHVTAFDRSGERAANAEVLVHDADGRFVGRTKLDDDGTGYVRSVEDATVTVVIRAASSARLIRDAGELTSFAGVPLGASLHVGTADSIQGPTVDIGFAFPPEVTVLHPRVDVACGFFDGPVTAPQFELHLPEGCTKQPRTVVLAASLDDEVGTAVYSVLHGAELKQDAVIQMPAFVPGERITLATDSSSFGTGAGVTVFADHEGFSLLSHPVVGPHMSADVDVPVSAWEATRYDVQLDVRNRLARVELGSPKSAMFAKADFLTKPVHRPFSHDRFDFIFTGAPDYRGLALRYIPAASNKRVFWSIFAPPVDEAIQVPELPADLEFLSPDGAGIESAVGSIVENTEHADYLEFLASDPAQLVPGTHRIAEVEL